MSPAVQGSRSDPDSAGVSDENSSRIHPSRQQTASDPTPLQTLRRKTSPRCCPVTAAVQSPERLSRDDAFPVGMDAQLEWTGMLVVVVLLLGYTLYTVFNLANFLGDYLRS